MRSPDTELFELVELYLGDGPERVGCLLVTMGERFCMVTVEVPRNELVKSLK